VNVGNLSSAITSTFDVIDRVTQEHAGKSKGVITSGREGQHMSDSNNYSGDAIDIRGSDVSDDKMGEIAERLQKQLGNDYDVIPEFFPENPLRDHIHIEYDPKNKELGCRKC
jgi:hypothetical protein